MKSGSKLDENETVFGQAFNLKASMRIYATRPNGFAVDKETGDKHPVYVKNALRGSMLEVKSVVCSVDDGDLVRIYAFGLDHVKYLLDVVDGYKKARRKSKLADDFTMCKIVDLDLDWAKHKSPELSVLMTVDWSEYS